MLETLMGITLGVSISTGAFWLLVRYGRKQKKPTQYYFLPWLLSVIGLSLVGFQIMDDAIDHDDAAYAVMLLSGFVWAYVWAKKQMTLGR